MNDAGHFPTSTSIHQAFLRQLCTLEIVSPFTLYLNWQLIIYELQLWRLVRIQWDSTHGMAASFFQRLVTCFFYLGTFSLPYCWNTWVLVRDGKWGRSSDVPHICDSMLQNVAEEVDVLEQTFPVRYTIAPRWKKWPFKENRPSTCGCWSVAQARCNALLC